MLQVKMKCYLFCLLFLTSLPLGLNATKLMAIYTYQTNGTTPVTILHQMSPIDSLKFDTDSMYIYKGGISNFRYNAYSIAKIDSIKYINGTAWSDNLTASIDVTSVGIVGDGITDNYSKLKKLTDEARAEMTNLYFPNGTYLCNGNIDAWYMRFAGQSQTGTIIKDINATHEHSVDGADNITFLDAFLTDFYWNYATNNVSLNSRTFLNRVFNNCTFQTTLAGFISGQTVYCGEYNLLAKVQFTNCHFLNPATQYSGILLRRYNGILIKNSRFAASGHPIYIQDGLANAKIEIIGDTIDGGTTGIFFEGNQIMPFVGALIQGNVVNNINEEAIAIDGIGNVADMVPVLGNGPIGAVSNDANGRPVINVAGMMGPNNKLVNISSRSDWNNFYFAFGTGSGLQGKVIKIVDFNSTNNTLTLDTTLVASNITVGGDAGIESGFFNFHIIGNTINNNLGTNSTYGTPISAYLNVFGFVIENNTANNSANGINVAGGLMLGYVRTLAYNNIVRNNTLTNCGMYSTNVPGEDNGVIRVLCYYSTNGEPLQYNNTFTGNTINHGNIYIENQRNLFFQNNNLNTSVVKLIVNSNVTTIN